VSNLPSKQKAVRHFFRVLWLRGFSFPFWNAVYTLREGWRAMHRGTYVVATYDELVALTTPLDEHPDNWDGPCNCGTCRSYADG
jgi:hypothetical protein